MKQRDILLLFLKHIMDQYTDSYGQLEIVDHERTDLPKKKLVLK